jgi:DNA-binding beta-propeller fold protein YncE
LVIDTQDSRVAHTIPLRPFGVPTPGIAPTEVAVSRDGSRLFVACGGLNAVVVAESRTGRLLGMIPTAWYPDSLALSRDGKYLAVATLLGPGTR